MGADENAPVPFLQNFVGFVIPFLVVLLGLSLFNPLARRFGWLDHPQGRKDHVSSTPLTGGLAVALGMFAALLIDNTQFQLMFPLCMGALLLLTIGIADDVRDLPWTPRLLAQIGAAAILIYFGGVRARYIGLPGSPAAIDLQPVSAAFTVFITVGVINAVNMADGCDGVVACVTLACLLLFGCVVAFAGNDVLLQSIFGLCGAIGGFFMLNMRFPWQRHARAFLGDSGTGVIGLAIAWVSIESSQTPSFPVSSVLAPWLLAPPLIDCVTSIARRIAHGQSPFYADRDHLHYFLLDAGCSPGQVASIIGGLTLLLGSIALLATYLNTPSSAMVAAFIALIVAYYIFTMDRPRCIRRLRGLLRKTAACDEHTMLHSNAAAT